MYYYIYITCYIYFYIQRFANQKLIHKVYSKNYSNLSNKPQESNISKERMPIILYTNKFINLISFIISISIYLLINIFMESTPNYVLEGVIQNIFYIIWNRSCNFYFFFCNWVYKFYFISMKCLSINIFRLHTIQTVS